MKILVVEDEITVAQAVEALLVSHHYAVDMATDGLEGLEMAEVYSYDLMLLDIGLPGLDGISLCQQLRAKGVQTPILLLTGQGAETHPKADALNAGADDYVTKPFDGAELLARIQTLLRRGDLKALPILTWGALSLDPSRLQVSYGETLLHLTPKEFSLIEVLLRHAPNILSARAILERGWNALETPGDETVRTHIKDLRKKLKAAGAPDDFIKTIHRQGYQLNPLYGKAAFTTADESASSLQIAELKAVNKELQLTLEQLHGTHAALRQKNRELVNTQKTLVDEQRQLRTNRDDLARQVADRNKKLTQTTHTLQQQQSQWQALFTHALEAILIADDGGRYVDANPAACKLLGMQREDLLKCNIADFADPALNMAEVWQQFLGQGQMSGEFRLYLPNGQVKDAEFNAVANYVPGQHLSIIRDISERKQAELALRESQTLSQQQLAEIETIYQSAPIGLNILDTDLRFVRINQRRAEMNGLPVDAHLGRTIREVLPEIANTTEQLLRPILATGEPLLNVEITGETPAQPGVQRTWLESFLPLKDGDRIIGISTVCEEITERKTAELALRQSEAKNRAILAALPDLIIRFDANGVYREVFSSGCNFNILSNDAVGQSMFEVLPADLAEQAYAHLQKALQTGKLQVFEQVVSVGDRVQYEEARVIKSGDDEVLFVIRDISEQKRLDAERQQAEQALRESERRLHAILDHSPAIIYVLDAQNKHLLVNCSYAELLSTTPENLVGKSLYEVWPAAIADRFATQNKTILNTGQLLQIEDTLTCSDGVHSYITVKFPLRGATGKPHAICGLSTDITERKNLETQFYQAQRLESLGTLAGGIAHDLNNVLTPILTVAQVLQLTQKGLDAKGLEQLKLLETSAKRGANLVKQILMVTRASRGERTAVDLAALMQEEIDIIRQSFPKAIEIQADVPAPDTPQPALGMILADSTYLHQIILNLCINARDAMPEGGALTISATQVFVDEAMAAHNLDAQVGQYAVITVSDTGMGIAPEVRERMFDPFFTTKAPGQGTGLGLATVRGLVKAHQGFVQVFSEVGQGTQFKVYFPLIKGYVSAQEPTQPTLQEPPDNRQALVLVVEDEETVCSMLRALLESHHYRTLLAQNGADALEQYRQYQAEIQLVVTDVMMPIVDGFTLINNVKAHNPDVPVIALSGVPTHEETALAAGADCFVAKPFEIDTLLSHISTLLNP